MPKNTILALLARKVLDSAGHWAFMYSIPVLFYLGSAIYQTWGTEETAFNLLSQKTPLWVIWPILSVVMLMLYVLKLSTTLKNTKFN
ncbi:hypothetical protein HB762_26700 (plasmid) [Vibrio campbellii]|uniref:Uncharacterized protein n=1 Tax=Vibrio campbellii TaxID=680 RepID=A0ABY5IKM5_9VIBR|nr:hypothetical protein [Vibrio campbellii]UTZ34853.1 hypothetical protein HB762_26700 [Vibrio campbellii]